MKTVTLSGSSKFIDVVAVLAWMLERDEECITMSMHLLPQWYSSDLKSDHQAEHENVAKLMDKIHLGKIDVSDELFVVDVDGYIGDSTRAEINHAISNGIPIRYFTTDEMGDKFRQRYVRLKDGSNE